MPAIDLLSVIDRWSAWIDITVMILAVVVAIELLTGPDDD